MASIRRTLSPSNSYDFERQRSHPSSSSSPLGLLFLRKPSRRSKTHHQWWRRSLIRFSLFFLLGLLLGFSPFAHLRDSDLEPHHFLFDSAGGGSGGANPSVGRKDLNLSLNHHRNLDALRSHEIAPLVEVSKLLIIVTPTYNRALQAYYMTRLAHTLRLVPQPLLWIVVEMGSASMETAELLRGSGVMYRHLVCERNSSDVKDRGVHQRNTALQHIERHRLDGVVYFADDDNIYSLQLFQQLREIRRFGTWPVAMLAQSKNKAILEGPVCNGSQVIGWHTNEKSRRLRRFHVDMSGFAFNTTILWDPKRWRHPISDAIRQLDTVKEGFQETTFIEQIVEDEFQMEGLPHNCSSIMNWHLHLDARHLNYPKGWRVPRNLDVVNSLN